MKKYYSFLLLFAGIVLTGSAQVNLRLRINHQLGNAAYSSTQVGANNLGNSFTLDRLEYYIGEIILTHDGGQITTLPNTYILVDANQTTDVLLGTFPINNLQQINFGIGLHSSVNHADPLLWPSNHPLAPRSPSMHWGWAAGYRFVALEGKTGPSMNQIFQIHALGDNNYYKQNVSTTGYLVGNDLYIDLNADYTQALTNIVVNGNLFNHGEFNEAATLLLNFNSSVFSQGTTAITELKASQLSLSPNPSNGLVNYSFSKVQDNMSYKLYDLNGRLVQQDNLGSKQNGSIHIDQAGLYSLQFFSAGESIGAEKILVK